MIAIHADFEKISQARKAMDILKEKGHNNAHLDMMDSFDGEFSTELNLYGAKKHSSLSAMVLKSHSHLFDVSKAPLMSAGPFVSGTGYWREEADAGIRLKIKVEEDKADEVKKILGENGGQLLQA